MSGGGERGDRTLRLAAGRDADHRASPGCSGSTPPLFSPHGDHRRCPSPRPHLYWAMRTYSSVRGRERQVGGGGPSATHTGRSLRHAPMRRAVLVRGACVARFGGSEPPSDGAVAHPGSEVWDPQRVHTAPATIRPAATVKLLYDAADSGRGRMGWVNSGARGVAFLQSPTDSAALSVGRCRRLRGGDASLEEGVVAARCRTAWERRIGGTAQRAPRATARLLTTLVADAGLVPVVVIACCTACPLGGGVLGKPLPSCTRRQQLYACKRRRCCAAVACPRPCTNFPAGPTSPRCHPTLLLPTSRTLGTPSPISPGHLLPLPCRR